MQYDDRALRGDTRAHWVNVWQQRAADRRGALSPDDQVLLRAMEIHPEFYSLWPRLDQTTEEIMVGEMNPVVHLMMDTVVENQLSNHDS